MNLKDYFKIVFTSLKYRKLRSWLTIFGIVIGITAVIALISLGQGMDYAVNKIFESIGKDRIMITPGGRFISPMMSEITTSKLTDKDLETILRIDGVEHAVGVISDTTKVEFSGETESIVIFGVPTDEKTKKFIQTTDIFLIEIGRQLEEKDKYKAVVGYKVAYDLFDKEIKLGDNIKINGIKFKVIGIQQKSGSPIHDKIIRIPLSVAKEMFEGEDYSSIFVKVKAGYDVDKVAEKIKEELRKERNVEKGKEDFSVTTAEELISGVNSIMGWVKIVFIGIAAISLLIGGIGIMNTMYTSVLERTKHIGIMKAVGAKNTHIFLLFLIESGILGAIGGIGGTILGISLGKIVEIIAVKMELEVLKVYITWQLVFFSILFSFLIGMIFGLLPALKAAKLKPIEAIRHG